MPSAQKVLRIVFKFIQLFCSIIVIYCLYNISPNWLLSLTYLLVPPINFYILLKSLEQKIVKTFEEDHYEMMKQRNWLRIEIAICATMTAFFMGFGLIFIFAFVKYSENIYLLFTGLSSILLALFYLINFIIILHLLRKKSIDFPNTIQMNKAKIIRHINTNHPSNNSIEISNICEQYEVTDCFESLHRNHQNSIINEKAIGISDEKSLSKYATMNKLGNSNEYKPRTKHFKLSDNFESKLTVPMEDEKVEIKQYSRNNAKQGLEHNDESIYDSIVQDEVKKRYRYAPTRNSRRRNIIDMDGGEMDFNNYKKNSISNQKNSWKRKVTPIPLLATHERSSEGEPTIVDKSINNNFKKCTPFFYNRSLENDDENCIKQSRKEKIKEFNDRMIEEENCKINEALLLESGSADCLNYNHKKELWNNEDRTTEIKAKESSNRNDEDEIYNLTTNNKNYKYSIIENNERYSSSIATGNEFQQADKCGNSRHYCAKRPKTRVSDSVQPSSFIYNECCDCDPSLAMDTPNDILRSNNVSSNLSHANFNKQYIPPIVVAIDSGRESEIIRNYSPRRRTSSIDKRMRSRGSDGFVKTPSDTQNLGTMRQRSQSLSTPSNEQTIDSFYITQF